MRKAVVRRRPGAREVTDADGYQRMVHVRDSLGGWLLGLGCLGRSLIRGIAVMTSLSSPSREAARSAASSRLMVAGATSSLRRSCQYRRTSAPVTRMAWTPLKRRRSWSEVGEPGEPEEVARRRLAPIGWLAGEFGAEGDVGEAGAPG
jgi:hypothetical protein